MIELLSGLVSFGHWLDSVDISSIVLIVGIPVLVFVGAYALPANRDRRWVYLVKLAVGVGVLVAGDWLAISMANWIADLGVACYNANRAYAECDLYDPPGTSATIMFGSALFWPLVSGALWLLDQRALAAPFFIGFLAHLLAWIFVFSIGVVLFGRSASILFGALLLSATVLTVGRLVGLSRKGELDRFIPELDRVLDRFEGRFF